MTEQSSSYRPFNTVRKVEALVEFGILNEEAKANCTISSTNKDAYSNLSDLKDGVNEIPHFIDLGGGGFVLDGSGEFISPDSVNTGYRSSTISDSSSAFESSNVPTLSIELGSGKTADISGFTLYFEKNHAPIEIKVTVWGLNGSGEKSKTFNALESSTTDKLKCDFQFNGFHKAEISFKWAKMPYQSIQVSEIYLGVFDEFDSDSIKSVNVIYEADIAGQRLPSKSLTVEIDNSDSRYDIFQDRGIYQYLKSGQFVKLKFIIDGETVDMGRFVFDRLESEKASMMAKITCYDSAIDLDGVYYNFAEGERRETQTLGQAIERVLNNSGDRYPISTRFIGGVDWSICNFTFENGTSYRKAIQLLAQASQVSAYFDRNNVLTFAPLDVKNIPDSQLSADELYDYSGCNAHADVDRVVLTVRDPITGTEHVYGKSYSNKNYQSVVNPCVDETGGGINEILEWLYKQFNFTIKYKVKNRCNPATEIGDTVLISNAYGGRRGAVITKQTITFANSELYAITEGVGT